MGSHCCKCADSKSQQQQSDPSISNIDKNQHVPTAHFNVNSADKIIQLALRSSKKKSFINKLEITKTRDKKSKTWVSTHDEAVEYTSSDKLKRNNLPYFVKRLTDVRVKIGSQLRLTADIQSSTMIKVTWFKNDKKIQMGGRFSMIDNGNLQIMEIVPVTACDYGPWTCFAENSYGKSTCCFFLTVITPKVYELPNFINHVQGHMTESGKVVLECRVFGVPMPFIQWFKDGTEIKAGDIFNLTAGTNDTTLLGYYCCRAVNCMGIATSLSNVETLTAKSTDILLQVKKVPTPLTEALVLWNIFEKKYCIIGDCITLTCRLEYLPDLKLHWFHRRGRVSPSEKYQITEEVGKFSIQITESDMDDEGLWECFAEDKNNMTHMMSYYVIILIPENYKYPTFLEPLKVIISSSQTVSFECKVVGIPAPKLKWFINDQELKRDDVYSLNDTSPIGSYCCVARNCMGEVKSTAELTMKNIGNFLKKESLFLDHGKIQYSQKQLRIEDAKRNSKLKFEIQLNMTFGKTVYQYARNSLIVSSKNYKSVPKPKKKNLFGSKKLKMNHENYNKNITLFCLTMTAPKYHEKPECFGDVKQIYNPDLSDKNQVKHSEKISNNQDGNMSNLNYEIVLVQNKKVLNNQNKSLEKTTYDSEEEIKTQTKFDLIRTIPDVKKKNEKDEFQPIKTEKTKRDNKTEKKKNSKKIELKDIHGKPYFSVLETGPIEVDEKKKRDQRIEKNKAHKNCETATQYKSENRDIYENRDVKLSIDEIDIRYVCNDIGAAEGSGKNPIEYQKIKSTHKHKTSDRNTDMKLINNHENYRKTSKESKSQEQKEGIPNNKCQLLDVIIITDDEIQTKNDTSGRKRIQEATQIISVNDKIENPKNSCSIPGNQEDTPFIDETDIKLLCSYEKPAKTLKEHEIASTEKHKTNDQNPDIKRMNDHEDYRNTSQESKTRKQKKEILNNQDRTMSSLTYETGKNPENQTDFNQVYTLPYNEKDIETNKFDPIESRKTSIENETKETEIKEINEKDKKLEDIQSGSLFSAPETVQIDIWKIPNDECQLLDMIIIADDKMKTKVDTFDKKKIQEDCNTTTKPILMTDEIENATELFDISVKQDDTRSIDDTDIKFICSNKKLANASKEHQMASTKKKKRVIKFETSNK